MNKLEWKEPSYTFSDTSMDLEVVTDNLKELFKFVNQMNDNLKELNEKVEKLEKRKTS